VVAKSTASALTWLTLGGLAAAPAIAAPPDETPEILRSDSRAPYAHRISLYDENGVVISPADLPAAPYSPMATCGKCHAYGTIGSGWHFNTADPAVDPGRPGEPWILADALTGTELPVSTRGWAGTYRPAEIDLTRWTFTKRFGRHFPGAGLTESSAWAAAEASETARWRVSGDLQIDCMLCHSADARHDQSEAARQIEQENFKWLPTASMALAVIRGEARKAPDDWDPLMPPDPDFPERAGPSLVYDKTRFDPDDRVFFDITRRPSDRRCYFCHTVREVGEKSPASWEVDRDVHRTAGLGCTDCHRHGLNHAMTRGYEGEPTEHADTTSANLTCRGCHLGDNGEDEPPGMLAGRLGAPYAEHRGLPPSHLKELTCTACHAGPRPTGHVKRFQTALAHGLGVASKERTDTTAPAIYGPVFLRQYDGTIAPHRMIWPIFWGWSSKGSIEPLPVEVAGEALRKALPERAAKPGQDSALEPEEVSQVLVELASAGGEEGEYVFVRNGRVYRHAGQDKLEAFDHPAALPYCWPIGHDVRPAAQSLGSGGCTDCHAADAPFSFGRIAPETATQKERPPIEFMYELQGKSPVVLRVWTSSFAFRAAFKAVGFGCLGVLAIVLLVYGLAGASALLRMGR
jgi:hypothetical protein